MVGRTVGGDELRVVHRCGTRCVTDVTPRPAEPRPTWLPATAIRMTVSKTPDRWKIYLNLLRDESKDDEDLDESS